MSSVQYEQLIDLIIPVYNEETVLDHLFEELSRVFSPEIMRKQAISRVRYIFIDDGSTDNSAQLISNAIRSGMPAMLLRFSRNYGHQSAVAAGLDAAVGEYVAILDADLQDPPELIWVMLGALREGYDVAYARRQNRKESALKRLGYWGFYRLIAWLSDIPMPVDSGDFCLMNKQVVEAIRRLPEKIRFPRVLRAWVGFRQTGVQYARPERRAGTTKYSFGRLYRLATDGIAAASTRPLKLAQVVSFTYLLLSCALVLYFLIDQTLSAGDRMPFGQFITLLVATTGFAAQSFCVYVLGAYLGRMYMEVKGRPPYIIMETIERPAEAQAATGKQVEDEHT